MFVGDYDKSHLQNKLISFNYFTIMTMENWINLQNK